MDSIKIVVPSRQLSTKVGTENPAHAKKRVQLSDKTPSVNALKAASDRYLTRPPLESPCPLSGPNEVLRFRLCAPRN